MTMQNISNRAANFLTGFANAPFQIAKGLYSLAERVCKAVYHIFYQNPPKLIPVIDQGPVIPPPLPDNLYHIREEGRGALYILDEFGEHAEEASGILGRGGSKVAVQLPGGRALLLPKYEVELIWGEMVKEEMEMSHLLIDLGLLTSSPKEVQIACSKADPKTIPAYICKSFENLGQTQNQFIIDVKNNSSSSWKQGKDYLFPSEEARLAETSWDSAIEPLLIDLAKIHMYHLPLDSDSLNIAVLKSETGSYQLRLFFFDFSNKYKTLSIPKIDEQIPSNNPNTKEIEYQVSYLVDVLFFWEFGEKMYQDSIRQLYMRLAEKYTKIVAQKQIAMAEKLLSKSKSD